MKRIRVFGTALALGALSGVACSDSKARSSFETQADPADQAGDAGPPAPPLLPPSDASLPCTSDAIDPLSDLDGDGYPRKHDCNECDPNANEGAIDVPGNGVDEDCSGVADDEPATCDEGLPIDAKDPFDAARALGLCRRASGADRRWGVVSAKYVKPDGSDERATIDVGALPSFGPNLPRRGKTMFALSTGAARAPNQANWESPEGWVKDDFVTRTPQGYPKDFVGCTDEDGKPIQSGPPYDGIALEMVIRVPSNARSFSYQQNFFTFEYSFFVCTQYNDFFVAILDPKPPALPDGNIAFDSVGNAISVNSGLVQVCHPGTYAGKTFTCPLGKAMLKDTGFEGHAATGWLTTTAPVPSGKEVTLRFAIWDSGDSVLDSTVLIDDFAFSGEAAAEPITVPTPH